MRRSLLRPIGEIVVRPGIALFLVVGATVVLAQPPRKKNAPPPGVEPPPVSLQEAAKLEAVVTTDLGAFRF